MPQGHIAHAALAKCLMKIGQPEAAIAELERLQAAWPTLDPDHFAKVAHPRQTPHRNDTDPGRAAILELAELWHKRHLVTN